LSYIVYVHYFESGYLQRLLRILNISYTSFYILLALY